MPLNLHRFSQKSGAFCNKDRSPTPRRGSCAHLLPARTPLRSCPQRKIFQPGPFPKREAFPSPRCPGVWCADNTPQLPQERSVLARELHNGIRRRGNKTTSSHPAWHSRVCVHVRAPTVGKGTGLPSPCIPASPDPSPLDTWGGTDSSSHPRSFVPKVGMVEDGKARAAQGTAELEAGEELTEAVCRADTQEVSRAKLRSRGRFSRQGEASLPRVSQQLLGIR